MTAEQFVWWLKGLLTFRDEVPIDLVKREIEAVILPPLEIKVDPVSVDIWCGEAAFPQCILNDSPYQGGIEKRYVVETNSFDS